MKKVFIAGHKGMVGSSLLKHFKNKKNIELILRSKDELDLMDASAVRTFFKNQKPDEVILAAAKVGGIHANHTYPANFIYENLQIQNNIIHQAHIFDVQKLLFLGSSCIYPKLAFQPMHEDLLLTGKLEETNEPYAIAKIAGIKMCESYNRQYGRDYRSVMPTNLYGPGDNYHPENSHVVPALIRRFHEAKLNNKKKVIVWGNGMPMREFLYVDDMAEASIFIHELDKITYDSNTEPMLSHINIGTGQDVTIKKLAGIIRDIVQFKGSIEFDHRKLGGTPKKLLNVSRLSKLGWEHKTDLISGLEKSYLDFKRIQNDI